MESFDVAVIGAGPAGTTAAITLAQRRYNVLPVDRGVFPRDKLCGDFINPINWPILEELDVSHEIMANEHAEVRRFRVTSAAGADAAVWLPNHGTRAFGLGVRRYHLDHMLLKRAQTVGVRVIEGARVERLRKANGWVVEFERSGERIACRSKVIVGADGRNSWVARRVGTIEQGMRRGPIGFSIQLDNMRAVDDSVEIHQFPGGYAGVVRVGPRIVNMAFTIKPAFLPRVVSFDTVRRLRLNENPFLRDTLIDAEACGPLRSVSPIWFPPRKSFGDGFLLVGDASCVSEPVTGEGIYFALRSGQLAGAALDAALSCKDLSESRLSQYHWTSRQVLRGRFRLNKLARVLTRHSHLLSALIRFSAKRRSLLDSMVRAVCQAPQSQSLQSPRAV